MKKISLLLIGLQVLFLISCTHAQTDDDDYKFTEASELNLIGKIIETDNPYHRVDTEDFPGFTESEEKKIRCSSGLAVLFKTNSSVITVKSKYEYCNMGNNSMGYALRGYDLYIKKDGKWLFANASCPDDLKHQENVILMENMDDSEKECLLYLPIYSQLESVKIGVEKDATIEYLDSPFRHRIGLFGSSYMHGISTTRSGMTIPMQFMRRTGMQVLSLACTGECEMQPYFGEVLNAADVDALLFDTFSNPSAETIAERLFPFIEQLQSVHPDIPLIFMQTIYRQSGNFDLEKREFEEKKRAMADKLMKEAVKKYKNVHYLIPDVGMDKEESSVDGIHPSGLGYLNWEKSIEGPILNILRQYGIQ